MPVNPVPVKQDVFKFVTFRGPNKTTSGNFELLTANHPDFAQSYWKDIDPSQGGEGIPIEQLISEFSAITSVDTLKESFATLYQTATEAYRKNSKLSEIPWEGTILTPAQEIGLFDQIIYQLFTRASVPVRESVAQIIAVNKVFSNTELTAVYPDKRIQDITVIMPDVVVDKVRPVFGNCEGELHGVVNLGIADFRRVEQEVCCYVPGEVSHIENVMAREYKERSTRNLVRTEDTIETSRETEIENLTDTTTATRFELNSEVGRVLDDMKTNNYGGSLGVSASYGGFSLDANASTNFSSSNSSSLSNLEAKQHAEEVTARALERIVQKTSEKRTSKIIKEFEEQYKHGFDNREGDLHVTGIYRWIDIIYKNRLINYGKRLMVEFMVPEPAEFYKRMLQYKPVERIDEDTTDVPQPPKKLSDFGINSLNDITTSNVYNPASYYGVTVPTLPTATMNLTKDLSPLSAVDHNRNTNTQSLLPINVPAEYEADKIIGSYTYEYKAPSAFSAQQAFCNFTFGGTIVHSGNDYSGTRKTKTVNVNIDFNPNLSGNIPVSVGFSGCYGFYGAVTIQCVLKQSVLNDWKADMYNKMQAAYNAMLDQYNQSIKNNADDAVATGQEREERMTNPAFNRIIEQRELKRICIEMLMKPFCKIQGRKNYINENACDLYQIPQVSQTQQFADYTQMVKFYEQAIDWQLMSYLFYPYYWADKCDWGNLLLRENDDAIFQAFLQSGMARVVVPIRLSFSEAFALYLDTGGITLGTTIGSNNYLSIVEELQTIEGTVEDVWETRVPTTLAIIQGKSAYLEEEGLPCCHTDEGNNITPSENLLGNIIPPTNP